METSTNQKSGSNKLLAILGIAFVVLVFSFLALGFLAKSALQKNVDKGISKVIKKELGKNADVNLNNDSVEIKTDEGSFSTSMKIPDSFRKDIPIYPDSKVTSSLTGDSREGKQSTVVTFETSDGVEKVMEYFKAKLKTNGWEGVASYSYSNSSTLSGEKESVSMVIVINGDTAGKTTIGITYSSK